MKICSALSITVVVCLWLAAPREVGAANYFFWNDGGDWATSGNWHDIHGVSHATHPDATDRAYIPSGLTCNLNADADIDTISVAGTLNCADGKTLTLHNLYHNVGSLGGPPDNSAIGGTVNLVGDFWDRERRRSQVR